MSKRLLCEVVLGCLLGLTLGVAVLYGLVELADWIVEQTHEFSR